MMQRSRPPALAVIQHITVLVLVAHNLKHVYPVLSFAPTIPSTSTAFSNTGFVDNKWCDNSVFNVGSLKFPQSSFLFSSAAVSNENGNDNIEDSLMKMLDEEEEEEEARNKRDTSGLSTTAAAAAIGTGGRNSTLFNLNNELESILDNHGRSSQYMNRKTLAEANAVFSKVPHPNTRSYTLLIQIHGKANAPLQAQRLLDSMLSRYLEDTVNNDRVKPNTITFTSTMDAWAQSNMRQYPQAPERAYDLLQRMLGLHQESFGGVEPNSISFDTVLHAFSKSEDGGEMAETILNRMEYFHQRSSGSTNTNTILTHVKPSVVSFTNVVNAWGNMKVGNHGKRAQSVMERMEALYDKTSPKDPALKLNTIIMNSVMDAYSKQGDGQKALHILHRMEDLHVHSKTTRKTSADTVTDPGLVVYPNTVSYNIVLKAFVKGNNVRKAQELFQKMLSFDDVNRMPDTRTYNTMLSGYSNNNKNDIVDGAKRAESILTHQIRSYQRHNNKNVKPDVISFTTCMNAIAKDRNCSHKAKKTREILDVMWDLSKKNDDDDDDGSTVYPNIYTYNTVLNAAAFSAFQDEPERQEAFLVALRTFNDLREMMTSRGKSRNNNNNNDPQHQLVPDEVTYGNMFKICANLLDRSDPKRTEMARRLWSDCCEAGLVGDMAWNELKRAVPVHTFLEWIPEGVSQRQDLPMEWRQNVKVERMLLKKKQQKRKNGRGSRSSTSYRHTKKSGNRSREGEVDVSTTVRKRGFSEFVD